MIIPIDDKWRIKSDEYNWIIQRLEGTRPNRQNKEIIEDKWVSKRFYPTLSKAAHGLAEYELMTGDTKTLAEALDAVRDVSDRLTRALAPHIEIV